MVKTEIVPADEKMTGSARADAREIAQADVKGTDLAAERMLGIAQVAAYHSSLVL
jgi:hypothetical protein